MEDNYFLVPEMFCCSKHSGESFNNGHRLVEQNSQHDAVVAEIASLFEGSQFVPIGSIVSKDTLSIIITQTINKLHNHITTKGAGMPKEILCKTIQSKSIISFSYNHGSDPGIRTVEPHMVADNRKNTLCLSAWYLSGNSASKEKPGFREYKLEYITNIKQTGSTFDSPRQGYDPTGGKVFHNVQCGL
jgi:hypothetical protein